jgi:hypothetical protein
LTVAASGRTHLGITKSRTSDLPVWILATLLSVAAAVAAGAAATHSLSGDAIGAASAMITVAGLLVALLQDGTTDDSGTVEDNRRRVKPRGERRCSLAFRPVRFTAAGGDRLTNPRHT